MSEFNKVIFKDKASAPAARKFFSLFPGLGYAAGYKVRNTACLIIQDGLTERAWLGIAKNI